MIYEPEDDEIPHEDDPLEHMEDPNFDQEYVAKVLNYKSQLVPSTMVGILSYKDPHKVR